MMPKIETAFNGWFSTITILKIVQRNYNGNYEESQQPIVFKGTIQPFKPTDVEVKSLGNIGWEWLMIHTKTLLDVKIGDKIIYKAKKYKLMQKLDYSLNSFFEYHLVEDYVD